MNTTYLRELGGDITMPEDASLGIVNIVEK